MTGGGKINKPKTARCRMNSRKLKRDMSKSKRSRHLRSEETVGSTTEDVLRQCRTNPKANVKLSGKKKRLLLKEAKRLVSEKKEMEVISESVEQKTDSVDQRQRNNIKEVTMDTS